MWIIAGPNGAGKTTIAREYFQRAIADKVWINPDDTNKLLRETYSDLAVPPEDTVNRLGSVISDARADHMIGTGQSLVVETVLSSDKYLKRIPKAQEKGFTVTLIYVMLRTPELAVSRVNQRFENGGHDVPEIKIRERWVRSLSNFWQLAKIVDAFTVWDNSTDEATGENPILVLDKQDSRVCIHNNSLYSLLRGQLASANP